MDDVLLVKLYQEGKSYAEIAGAVGIANNVAKSAVYRHLKRLGVIGRKRNYEDLTGKKFGDIEVKRHLRTGRYPKGGIYQVWECQCKCGKTLSARAGNLKNGQVSCKECATESLSHHLRQIPIDYKVWYALCWRAKRKGLEVSVTPEYLWGIFEAQRGRCALSGVAICFGKYRSRETTASPDRIDTNVGYVEGNVRWVHKIVNAMRNTMSIEELIEWCRTIIHYQNRRSDERPFLCPSKHDDQ